MICGYKHLDLLMKHLPEVIQITLSSDKKKTRQKQIPSSYKSLALPQSKSFGQYTSNIEFSLSN